MTRLLQAVKPQHVIKLLSIVSAWLVFSSPLRSQEPKLQTTLNGHTADVWSVAFSRDGKMLVSAGTDNNFSTEIKIWDVSIGKIMTTLHGPGDQSWCYADFSPDSKSVASGNGIIKIKLWDLATRKSTTFLDDNSQYSQYAAPKVVFSPDGKTLASGGRCMRNIDLWNVATGRHIATLKGHDEYGIVGLAIAPDGKTLLSVGIHDGLKRWELESGKTISTEHPDDDDNAITCVAFSPDCKLIVSGEIGETANEIKLWNGMTGKKTAGWKIDEKCGHLTAAAISPDSTTLALGSKDNIIRLWDIATSTEQSALKGHSDTVLSLTFSPDGKTLASSSADKTIKLWDVVTRN